MKLAHLLSLPRHHLLISTWKSHLKFQRLLLDSTRCAGCQVSTSISKQYCWRVPLRLSSEIVSQRVPCYYRPRCISTTRWSCSSNSTRDKPDLSAPDPKNILETDPELRAILKDIEKDFEGPPPPPPKHAPRSPPKATDAQEVVHNTEFASESDSSVPKRDDQDESESRNDGQTTRISLSIMDKFKDFQDADAEVILDVDEQRRREAAVPESAESPDQEFYLYQEKKDEFAGCNVKRGVTGVYDIEELVQLLRDEKMRNIAVMEIPASVRYADYIVVATAMSPRHSKAVLEFIRKLHKLKKHPGDPFLIIEGQDTHDWRVLDMGNIVLHVFLEKTRQVYDLETLWTVGEDYDSLVHQQPDPMIAELERQMHLLQQMQPLQDNDQVQEQMMAKE